MSNGKILLALVGALSLGACAGPNTYDYQRYQYTAAGAAVGALAGGVIGHQVDRDTGRYYGAAAGALLGGAIGNNMDQTRALRSANTYNPYQQPTAQYSQNNYPAQQAGYAPPPPNQQRPYSY